MNSKKTGCVKARSVSKMTQSKSKVQFTPTPSSVRRMRKGSQASHIKSENNILRFGSGR